MPAAALPENWNRPELEAVRQKVNLFTDPDFDLTWPSYRSARVEVVTDRGSFEETVLVAKGTAENPLTWDEQVEKFTMLSRDRLGTNAVNMVVDKVRELDRVQDVNELTELLRPQR
jgi:2-methylcitrate dehydratase PrpD